MRPLSLTMQAIGPFKSKTSIDFGAIGDHELFLIHGATGRGKSFIFDSICYALYGATPSKRESHFKSDHAEPGTEPFVEFSFTLGEDRYRIRRQPVYTRPKARGEGETEQKESVELIHIDSAGGEKTLESTIRNVKTKIEELLGLDMGQFSQVVLLPQGEFRKLLLAESAEREVLLEKLFDSSWYENVQSRIGALKKEKTSRNDALIQRREDRATQARSTIPQDLRPDESTPLSVESLEAVVEQLNTQMQKLEPEIKVLSSAYEKAVKDCESAKTLKENLESFSQLKEADRKLQEEADNINKLESELKLARTAQNLLPLIKELNEIDQEIKNLDDKIKVKDDHLKSAERDFETARQAHELIPSYKERLKTLRHHESGLKKLVEVLKTFQAADDAIEGSEEKEKAASEALKETRNKLKELEEDKKKAANELKKLKEKKVDITACQNQLKTIQQLAGLNKESADTTKKIDKLHKSIEEKKKEHKQAEAAFKALKERRERNLAGELAQDLKSGEACPVCGSKEHPEPAKLFDEEATRDALADAEYKVEQISKDLQTLERESSANARLLKDKKETITSIEKEAGDLPSAEELNKTMKDEKSRLDKVKELDGQLEILREQKIPDRQRDQSELVAAQSEAKTNLKNAHKDKEKAEKAFGEAMTEELEAYFEEDEISVDTAAAVAGSIPGRIEEFEEKIEAAENRHTKVKEQVAELKTELKGLKDNKQSSSDKQEKKTAQLQQKIESSPFKNKEEVHVAVRDDEWMTGTENSIDDFEKRKTEVASQLKAMASKVENKTMPDVEALKKAQASAKQQANEKQAVSEGLKHTVKSINEHAQKITNIDRQSAGVLKELELLGRLSDQLNGKSAPKISLKRFFLSQRLDEVVILATHRLLVMSNGRFELKRTDSGRTAAAQAGLDLCVVDNFTGTERPVNSLSGGQMFLASISMALGLADVVQARSGGIRLDTLFVDEGFGSLDDETLHVALEVLNELREGRMVGVISHVSELKRQIEKKIEVLPAHDAGSAIKMST